MGKKGNVSQADLVGELIRKKQEKAKNAPKREPTPRKAAPEPPPVPSYEKSKSEWELNQRRLAQEKVDDRKHFLRIKNEEKRDENKPIDEAFTYVEVPDKDPIKVPDIDEYWLQQDLKLLPFLPQDEQAEDQRAFLDFIRITASEFEKILKMRFNVFWSHMLLTNLGSVIEDYLRFTPRPEEEGSSQHDRNLYSAEIDTQARLASRYAFFICIRASKRGESERDKLSEKKFSEAMKKIWNIPMLLDFCTLYGETNFGKVYAMVHEVFDGCPDLHGELRTVTFDLRDALDKSVTQARGHPDAWVYVEDCLKCLEALQSYFPMLDEDAELDLQRLTQVYEAAASKQQRKIENRARRAICAVVERRWRADADDSVEKKEAAFNGFEAWIQQQDEHLLEAECWAPVLERWKTIKAVDDVRIDYYLGLTGAEVKNIEVQRVGPKDIRVGTAASSSSAAPPPVPTDVPPETMERIKRVLDVLETHGEGWAYLCLEHYDKVEDVIEAVFNDTLPASLAALQASLTLPMALEMKYGKVEKLDEIGAMDHAAKANILAQIDRLDEAEEAKRLADLEQEELEYNDEPTGDDDIIAPLRVFAGQEDDSEGESDEELPPPEITDTKGKGKGKGKGKDSRQQEKATPTQGQSYGARKKEANKSARANHSRKNRFAQKMRAGT